MPGANKQHFPPTMVDTPNTAFMDAVMGSKSTGGIELLLGELITEIRGLRNDIRQEVLQREIAKLPEPIRNAD